MLVTNYELEVIKKLLKKEDEQELLSIYKELLEKEKEVNEQEMDISIFERMYPISLKQDDLELVAKVLEKEVKANNKNFPNYKSKGKYEITIDLLHSSFYNTLIKMELELQE